MQVVIKRNQTKIRFKILNHYLYNSTGSKQNQIILWN